MIIFYPVMQTLYNHFLHHRMVAVHGIATTGEVIIIAFGCQHVINIIIEAFERDKRSVFIPFCRMVEYHIQDYFNVIFF